MAPTNDRAGLTELLTLAIDIGGSHLKRNDRSLAAQVLPR
jgi:hypothetical protein